MKRLRNIKTVNILALLTTWLGLSAQDLHFSQFNEHTSVTNPGLTGIAHPMRASIHHKNQWRSVTSAYQTYAASIETRFKQSNWQQVDQFKTMTFKRRTSKNLAGGLSLYKDVAGDGEMGFLQANLNLSSSVPLNKYNTMSVGIQGALAQRSINYSVLVFPNQFNGERYDASRASRENLNGDKYTYADFGAGIVWINKNEVRRNLINEYRILHTGLAVFHVAEPQTAFLGQQTKLYRRYVFTGNYEIGVPYRSYALIPSLLVQMQGPYNEVVVGSAIRYIINKASKYTGLVRNHYLQVGLYYRHRDAIIITSGLEWKEQYALMLSYDLNISSLKATSHLQGGLEVTLRFTKPAAFLYEMKK